MFSATRLLFAAIAAAGIYLSGHGVWQRAGEQWLLPVSPLARAEQLAAEGRWAEARMIAEFVIAHPRLGDAAAAAELSARAQRELDSVWGAGYRFAQGAVSGEPFDTASMLGSLSLDLFVIGDIRDLLVQGWQEFDDGSGDDLIIALSALGVATTLTPQVDWAPALLKGLKRSQALNRRFVASLRGISKRSMRSGDLSPLRKVAGDIGDTAVTLGAGPLRGTLRHVDTTVELERLAGAARIDARAIYSVVALFGRRGITALAPGGANIVSIAGSIKVATRLTKTVSKWTAFLPLSWLLVMFASCALLLAMCLRPRRRTRRPPLPGHPLYVDDR